MIRDRRTWAAFEKQWIRQQKATWEENARIFWSLVEQARILGVWPPKNPLEGIEHDVNLATVLRSRAADLAEEGEPSADA